MANDAAKKNAKAWRLYSKVIGGVTAFVTLLFWYFGVNGNEGFGFWSWIGYFGILIAYWFSISTILSATANGLPIGEVYKDTLGTAWAINILMIFSGWFWWLGLWVPALYLYKLWQHYKSMFGMAQAGMANDANNNGRATGKRSKKRKKKRRENY